jgi:two-component system response regulator NreC
MCLVRATLTVMSDPGTESGEVTSIVLADDHAVVRGALKALLEGQADFRVVGEAADIASARLAVREHRPRVLVLDVNMPDGDGVEAVTELRQEAPTTEIVLLTMQRDLGLVRDAIDSGARSYLFKDAAHLELIEAVRSAVQGREYLPADIAAGLSKREETDDESPLTPRENEVLRLIALGYTGREIGEQLSLSTRTVETHREHIQQKLLLRTRPELTRYALKSGLLDL